MKNRLALFMGIMMASNSVVGSTVNFNQDEDNQWLIVNDSVMGGVSRSAIEQENGVVVFLGDLSLENYGGFASVRLAWNHNTTKANRLSIRVKGDGKQYKLRLRSGQYWDGPAYSVNFQTTDTWKTLSFSSSDFKLVYRGREFRRFKPVNFDDVNQIGIMLSDKQVGPFELKLDQLTMSQK